MDEGYGGEYRALYEAHWWWRAREKVVRELLDRYRPGSGWARALDVGCGDGLLFDVLAGYASSVEGVEPEAAMVSDDREGRIHVRPFDRSFEPEHRFDLMLFLDVLEHIPDAEAAVAHAASLLEPGGTLIVTVPAFLHLWTTHDVLNRHVTRYTKRRLEALLSSDLEVRESRYFFRWVHAAKIAQRALEVLRRPEPAAPRIPPPPVNRTLYTLSRAEHHVLGRLPIPLGSSLLAVARKP